MNVMPKVASHTELKLSSSSRLTHCVNYISIFNTKITADSDVTAESQPMGIDITV